MKYHISSVTFSYFPRIINKNMNNKYNITNPKQIRTVLCVSKRMAMSYLPDKLEAIGTAMFRGDLFPIEWSVNDKFEIGKEYPIYFHPKALDSMNFAVGEDGIGYKMNRVAWTDIKYFK